MTLRLRFFLLCFVLLGVFGVPFVAAGDVADASEPSAKEEEEDEARVAWALLVMLSTLAVCLIVAHYLESYPVGKYLHESAATVIISAIAGLFFRTTIESVLSSSEDSKFDSFDPQFFFILLLPPIIFEAGYSMKRRSFFRNFGSIMLFAVLGTFISAMVIGFAVWGAGLTGLFYKLPFVESMMFGSLISAVDPVTVIAIFTEMKLDGTLFSLIFGESIMNDAVCIVLFKTMYVFLDADFNIMTIVNAIFTFFLIFIGSFGLGISGALLAALLFKYVDMRKHPHIETAIFFVCVYAPYLIAEGLELSGIVAILFCGALMSHYTYYNLSKLSQDTTKHISHVMAYAAEMAVFSYLGLSLFTFKHHFDIPLVILVAILCLVSRAMNIYPLSFIANFFRKEVKISPRHQVLLYWGGLRGAIAFALSVSVPLVNVHRPVIVTTTLLISLFTIFVFGSSIYTFVRLLKIRSAAECEAELETRIRSLGSGFKKTMPMHFMDFDQKYLHSFFKRDPFGGDTAAIFEAAQDVTANVDGLSARPGVVVGVEEGEEMEMGVIASNPRVSELADEETANLVESAEGE